MKMFRWSNVSLVFLQTRVVFVQGIPQNATEDTVLNYFENSRRSGGGAVEEVKIKGNVARVQFESSEGNSTACVTGSFVCVRETKASPRGGWNQRRWWHFVLLAPLPLITQYIFQYIIIYLQARIFCRYGF